MHDHDLARHVQVSMINTIHMTIFRPPLALLASRVVCFLAAFFCCTLGVIMNIITDVYSSTLGVLAGKPIETDNVNRPIICDMKSLRKIISISRSMVYEKLNEKSRYYDPNFPRPFTLKGSRNYWLLSEVHAYILSMASKRKNGGAA